MQNMIEEFSAYGLTQTTMVVVGVFGSISFNAFTRLGLKTYVPAALGMALFMTAAVYFHFSISDPIVPTAPSLIMLISCVSIIYIEKKLN